MLEIFLFYLPMFNMMFTSSNIKEENVPFFQKNLRSSESRFWVACEVLQSLIHLRTFLSPSTF